MWVYIQSEPNLYTVGFYSPNGEWHPDSDWGSRKQAAARVAWLNGRPTGATGPGWKEFSDADMAEVT